MRVLRFELEITDHQVVELPLSSKILSVAPGRYTSSGDPGIDMWALVPEVAAPVPHSVYVVGTGNLMPPRANTFIGTVVLGELGVWHCFTHTRDRS